MPVHRGPYTIGFKKTEIFNNGFSSFDNFDDFTDQELNELSNILDKQSSMEEFCMKSDIYGWDDAKKAKVFENMRLAAKAQISYVRAMRHHDFHDDYANSNSSGTYVTYLSSSF